ncbi:MarR family transcriptional regulator [Acidithiobacillus sp. AMEEHan]|uniref:MarR family transcriptional regulator n=1 Tax=Acidithiobacillus sp. AMEEHan TaxID=2994951 RepID=UPI0027E442D1|nr:MarR family transcriptional regulator [Acidithiobacillus sp. AMEEHan]
MDTETTEGQTSGDQGTGGSPKSGGGNPMEMGMGMMKKMMGEGGSPMAMMQKMMGQKGESTEGGNPMQQMMGTCMAMCSEMLETMHRTTSLAAYAQPELHQLFEEWLATREDEVLELVEQGGSQDPETLAEALSLRPASVTALLAHLQNQGKIHLHAEAVRASKGG